MGTTNINLDNYAPEVYLTEKEIKERVKALAESISKDYWPEEELLVVCVLKGAFLFCGDLVRNISLPVKIEFISLSSYGAGTESSGQVKLLMDISSSIEGKNVLLVEDIVDTGLTVKYLMDLFGQRKPKTLRLCSLLYKPARVKYAAKIDYLAFEIEDKFVVGYGLDYAGRYRELPYIGILNAE